MKKPLKLFVWHGVFCDYTCGMAVAIARTKEDAMNQIAKEHWPGDHDKNDAQVASTRKMRADVVDELSKETCEVHPLTKRFAVYSCGGG